MNKNLQNLTSICEELNNNGITPKITILKATKGPKRGWNKGNNKSLNVGLHGIIKHAVTNHHNNKCGKV